MYEIKVVRKKRLLEKIWRGCRRRIKKHWRPLLVLLVSVVSIVFLIWTGLPTRIWNWAVSLIKESSKHSSTGSTGYFGQYPVLASVFVVTCILLSIAVAAVIAQMIWGSESKDDKDAEKGDEKSKKGDKDTWSDWFRNQIKNLRENPIFFPFYLVAGWFAITGTLWLFREKMAGFSWPGNNVSAWQWLRYSNPELFFFTPIVVLFGTWFALAKSRFIKGAGILIWITLLLVWWVTIRDTTKKTVWWQNWKEASATTPVVPQFLIPQDRDIVVPPGTLDDGVWPEDGLVVVPDDYFCNCKEEGPVFIRFNRDERTRFEDHPGFNRNFPGKIRAIELKSAGPEPVIVHLTFFKRQR